MISTGAATSWLRFRTRHDSHSMTCDHGLLVGGDDSHIDVASRRAEARRVGGVGGRVDSNAEPTQSVADLGADLWSAFSDPGGEHEAFEAAERTRQSRDLEGDAVREQVE